MQRNDTKAANGIGPGAGKGARAEATERATLGQSMRRFSFGQTLAITYPNHQNLAGFVVARNDAGQPYLICYNNDMPRLVGTPQQPLTQGEGFICEGVPFKVDNDDFALIVGEVTGKERDAIIPFIPKG